MKPLQMLCLSLVISSTVFSQNPQKETYLAVRVFEQYDKTNKTRYYILAPDLYNNYANDIYNMVTYNQEPYNNRTGISFYFQKTDSSRVFYNYFRSQTEALQFLADDYWQLVSVTTEINSGHETARASTSDEYHVYTTVSSRPVFYFRKTVQAQ